jgi:macrophage erythroblast attacher
MKQWGQLLELFRKELLDLHAISQRPQLISNIQAGLSSLKTPLCGRPNDVNINCPVCVPPYADLAAELPLSHHENSCIVCRITGQVMNENNPPMILPNGHVYSQKALQEMAIKSDGSITCPRTLQVYEYSQAKKVFIL